MKNKNAGFTIIEWMIAMVIGLFLLGGVLSVYVSSNASTQDSFDNSELQENGRIAMNLLVKDLRKTYFWGELTDWPISLDAGITLSPAATALAAGSDCLDNRAIGSFPTAANALRSIWAVRLGNPANLGGVLACLSTMTLQPNSDVIVLKHLRGDSLRNVGAATAATVNVLDSNAANRFFMAVVPGKGYFFRGNENLSAAMGASNPWIYAYQHDVYYVTVNNNIPELRKRELFAQMQDNLGPLVRGVEAIRILFAVDGKLTKNNIPDRYLPPEQVTDTQWDNDQVIGARIFILVRGVAPIPKYTNKNIYQLGDTTYDFNAAPDNYRRLLLQSSVSFIQ